MILTHPNPLIIITRRYPPSSSSPPPTRRQKIYNPPNYVKCSSINTSHLRFSNELAQRKCLPSSYLPRVWVYPWQDADLHWIVVLTVNVCPGCAFATNRGLETLAGCWRIRRHLRLPRACTISPILVTRGTALSWDPWTASITSIIVSIMSAHSQGQRLSCTVCLLP